MGAYCTTNYIFAFQIILKQNITRLYKKYVIVDLISEITKHFKIIFIKLVSHYHKLQTY